MNCKGAGVENRGHVIPDAKSISTDEKTITTKTDSLSLTKACNVIPKKTTDSINGTHKINKSQNPASCGYLNA